MKKKIICTTLFIASILAYADRIEDGSKKIKTIDNQLSKNNTKINQNKGEITKAKTTEQMTASQIKQLDDNITKLESEYNKSKSEYTEILKKIGKSDAQIKTIMEEIDKNSQIINVSKEDMASKLATWDKVRKSMESSKGFDNLNTVERDRRVNDLKIILKTQSDYVKSVEGVKKGVEGEKSKEESIKTKNQEEANAVNRARVQLESKNRELGEAKKTKLVAISQLRSKQQTLVAENTTIQKSNTQLVAEKNQIKRQIDAIVAKGIEDRRRVEREKSEEMKRIESAKIAAAEQKKRLERQSQERNNAELSGPKVEPTIVATNERPVQEETPRPQPVQNTQPKVVEKPVQIPEERIVTPRKGTGSLSMPINGSIVLGYGQEKVAGLRSNGIEIRGSVGQAVKAADSGVVIYAGSLGNLGSVVIIDHGSLVTVYGNLSGASVSKGSNVSKGQTIGTLGRDSTSKEPNLYFETRQGVSIVNPMSHL